MPTSRRSLILAGLMLGSAGLAAALRPTISLADERPPIDLDKMVPKAFGDWQISPFLSSHIVDPQTQEKLDEIYSQTLSRTYVNRQGYAIMLSIAYGKNQSDALQLHKPEVCYPAQGFQLQSKRTDLLALEPSPIPATRLMTQLQQRREPVTYWTVIGDQVTTGGLEKKLAEMRYAMRNRIPDGFLIRVSSIDANPEGAYVQHNAFAKQMVAAIAPEHRLRFGSPSAQAASNQQQP